jgi:hypothetical protein
VSHVLKAMIYKRGMINDYTSISKGYLYLAFLDEVYELKVELPAK